MSSPVFLETSTISSVFPSIIPTRILISSSERILASLSPWISPSLKPSIFSGDCCAIHPRFHIICSAKLSTNPPDSVVVSSKIAYQKSDVVLNVSIDSALSPDSPSANIFAISLIPASLPFLIVSSIVWKEPVTSSVSP